MNKSEFHMILSSNSSINYFPDNTASNYTTMLPEHIKLEGEWMVGLKEIQFPANFFHIHSKKDSKICIIQAPKSEDMYHDFYLPERLYKDPKQLIYDLNNFVPLNYHFSFELNEIGQTKIKRICKGSFCNDTTLRVQLSDTLLDILGFDRFTDKKNTEKLVFGNKNGKSYEFSCLSKRPISLIRGLPNSLFIYSDICIPYVTGDVNSALLRIVSIDTSSYIYGMTITSTYGVPNYIPVLSKSFRTIEIDIRDNEGDPVPFDYGPLNVTLHFKRVD